MRSGPDRRTQRALEARFGSSLRILGAGALGGGSIARVRLLETSAGRFVEKCYPSAGGAVARSEAQGLALLGCAGAELRVPGVIHVDEAEPALLIIEYLEAAARRPDFDACFGRGLASLHQRRGSTFGLDLDNFCGATPQDNRPSSSWVEFYAERRLGFQVERAARAGLLDPSDRRRLETLIQRLPELIDEPPEGPALIHGDLWSGNLLVDASGGPALIDPACYFAHREAELGMMTLFGGFSERVYAAYDEFFPLAKDWRGRNRIYQLYHLLNHLNLFGRSYLGSVMAAARA